MNKTDWGSELGMARVIAIFSHEFSSAAFIVPLIAGGNYYAAGVFTGYEVTKIAVKQIVQSLFVKDHLLQKFLPQSLPYHPGSVPSKICPFSHHELMVHRE